MIRSFVSRDADPHQRGVGFGEAWRSEIRDTVAGYEALFARAAGGSVELDAWGGEARLRIEEWAPALAREIEGIAAGADLRPEAIFAINARTEILARLGGEDAGECSTIVSLRDGTPPISVQTWDWYSHLIDSWLHWRIELPGGGAVETVTEFGIVGKISVNHRGFGVHFNLLRHRSDGGPIGVPVHVVARRAVEEAADIEEALRIVAGSRVSASTCLTFVASQGGDATALGVELSPEGPRIVLPDERGVLIHTNHFLDPVASGGDREPGLGGDSWIRYDLIRRRLAGRQPRSVADAVKALDSHLGGMGALCAHADAGKPDEFQYETLATVSLDLDAGRVMVRSGGPCLLSADGYNVTDLEGAPR